MFFNRYFVPSFALIIIIALLHYLALDRAYYWTISWYDIMMHFLGGVWVALFALWIFSSRKISFLPTHISFLQIVSLVICVGIVWELYEIMFGLTFVSDPEYWGDTILDLVMDTIGGICVAFSIRNKSHV
ncbi:MAG: hypothetical protein COV01_00165 [Candidatus Taylorbacteria bacterium CG10_big_fil_rev_8_21_14_0_10_41_48]|uniref:VanZ-like domain-containing protein n=1 Tax=Candidatus Taylorbacteria bacterium CG10_big_fil_rev_8_21_14_0_10_41_48 TaxID=1975024 RepID=A0A2M8LCU9_9BACT|nr:MAG: hypothetical protein COV01_00165 [Candidatus Taylorbacteria bacterium CG10_big_fil_rev_8_21_14_0_10_41_48]